MVGTLTTEDTGTWVPYHGHLGLPAPAPPQTPNPSTAPVLLAFPAVSHPAAASQQVYTAKPAWVTGCRLGSRSCLGPACAGQPPTPQPASLQDHWPGQPAAGAGRRHTRPTAGRAGTSCPSDGLARGRDQKWACTLDHAADLAWVASWVFLGSGQPLGVCWCRKDSPCPRGGDCAGSCGPPSPPLTTLTRGLPRGPHRAQGGGEAEWSAE